MSKFWWKTNLKHKLRIFEIVILDTKWEDCKFPKNLCTKNFTYTKQFYIQEIATLHLSKIYFLKNTKKTCKSNNRDLNHDWKMKTGIITDFIFWGFVNRSNHQHMFWKMLLIKCRKNICEGVLLLKK